MDGADPRCHQWLADKVKAFRRNNLKGKLLLYASLPCVGGSPWGNVNGQTTEGAERIKEQQHEFNKLFKGFQHLVELVNDSNTFVAFELSRRCKYWRWPMVKKFMNKHALIPHSFHGCKFGVAGRKGLPMMKGWTIASNMETMSAFDSYQCGTHKHDDSRGEALKLAENYTHKLTDLIHECYMKQITCCPSIHSSYRTATVRRACPAMASSSHADATRKGEPRLFPDYFDLVGDIAVWEEIFCNMACVSCTRESALNQENRDATIGFMRQFTCQSVASLFLREIDWVPNIHRMLTVDHEELPKVKPPEQNRLPGVFKRFEADTLVAYVITSDSTLAMVSGGKKTARRHDLKEAFNEGKRSGCFGVYHEMLWGKGLQQIVKVNVDLIKRVKNEFAAAFKGQPEKKLRIVSLLVWSHNEMVGKYGVDPTGFWPFGDPEGDPNQIERDTVRHLRWYAQQLERLDVQSAALMCEPPEAVYGNRPIGQFILNRARQTFHEEISQYPYGRIRWIKNDDLPWRIQLKDHYHAELSHNNAQVMSYHILATCFLLNIDSQLEELASTAEPHEAQEKGHF